MEFIALGLALIPVWVPLLKLASLRNTSEMPWSRPSHFAFAATFVWTGGGISYLWISKVPSGIPYGIVLMIGWIAFLVSIVLDVVSGNAPLPPKKNL
ncbi:MAG: hypothetical protein HYU78_15290 [Rhodocyclales bacterium]|nr:hypothetical protein [Rhodocyclales bacterium]